MEVRLAHQAKLIVTLRGRPPPHKHRQLGASQDPDLVPHGNRPHSRTEEPVVRPEQPSRAAASDVKVVLELGQVHGRVGALEDALHDCRHTSLVRGEAFGL